jgi:hypothetical protein
MRSGAGATGNTVRRAETADEGTSLTAANELAIRRTFEAAGVEFTNREQPDVRLAETAMIRSAGKGTGSRTARLPLLDLANISRR